MPQEQEHQGIFTNTFSGLNLLSNGSLDAGDCSIFQNCDIDSSGALVRRGGTESFVRYNYGVATGGRSWQTVLKTKNGTEYLVTVTGSSIIVSLIFNDNSVRMPYVVTSIAKNNVWGQPLTNVNFVLISAPHDKLLILTGNHPPVELSFLEKDLPFLVGVAATTSLTFNAELTNPLWRDTNIAGTLVFDKSSKLLFPVLTKSGAFSLTVANNAALVNATTKRLTIASITWQWWVDSEISLGANWAQTKSRVNVSELDQNVEVPVELLTNFEPIMPGDVEVFNLFANSQPNLCTLSYTSSSNPSTDSQYVFTNGGRYLLGSANVQLGSFFCTFGTKQPTGVSPITISRLRKLRTSETTATVNSLGVYVDDVKVSHAFTNCNAARVVYRPFIASIVPNFSGLANILVRPINTTEPFNALDFFGGQTIPPLGSQIRLLNYRGVRYFGSSAKSKWIDDLYDSDSLLDGKAIAVYGASSFCNYVDGLFPSIGTMHRDRLVLSGVFNTDQIVCSAINDSLVPGEYYNFFQIDENLQGTQADPFSINVTSDSKNGITALASWQDALLVFTSDSVYNVVAGEQFSQSSFRVTLSSAYGAFNQRCVVVSDLSVVFMNRYGVYDLVNKPNTSQLGSSERSLKVKPLFNDQIASPDFDNLHWLIFDESSGLFYLGLATDSPPYTSRHLMLNIRYEAWSTLTSASPFRMFNPVKFDNNIGLFAVHSSEQYVLGLIANRPHYLDFATHNPSLNWTTPVGVQELRPSARLSPQRRFVSEQHFFPHSRDMVGVDVVKMHNHWVATTPTATLTSPRLTIADSKLSSFLVGGVASPASWIPFAAASVQSPFTLYPRGTYQAVQPPGTNFVIGVPTDYQGLTVPNVAASCLYGSVYSSIACSRAFDFSSMGRLKRLKRLHLNFDTSIVVGRKYPNNGLENVRQVNIAQVAVTTESNHIGQVPQQTQDANSYSTGSQLNSTFYDTSYEIIGVKQHSLPLQGYGVQYRWWLGSVGAEAFKLTGYEFEVEAQRDKRYQPG